LIFFFFLFSFFCHRGAGERRENSRSDSRTRVRKKTWGKANINFGLNSQDFPKGSSSSSVRCM
jgi:hypothetical protein